jgi:hypothetical protein
MAEGEATPTKSRRPPVTPLATPANPAPAGPADAQERPADQSANHGEVVSLDRFRKK